MNGATTEPCARISRPPISTVTMMIGSSQNLRRSPRNLHIWTTTSIPPPWGSSEQVAEAVYGRAGRLAALPVGRRRRLVAPGERIAPERAHQKRHRREDDEEDDAHDDRAHHLVQQLAEFHPGALERRQQLGTQHRDQ